MGWIAGRDLRIGTQPLPSTSKLNFRNINSFPSGLNSGLNIPSKLLISS